MANNSALAAAVQVRFTQRQMQLILAEMGRMRKANPGLVIRMSDAIRAAVERGLSK